VFNIKSVALAIESEHKKEFIIAQNQNDKKISIGALQLLLIEEKIEGKISADMLRALAAELYDTIDKSEEELSGVIRDIVSALQLYQGIDVPAENIIALIDDGIPVFLEDHVILMSRGFKSGAFVTLESFLETLVDWEAFGLDPYGPITINHLRKGFEGLVDRDEYETVEIIPAIILLLGFERAFRSGEIVDSVWADLLLDPLQFCLLSYTLFTAADETLNTPQQSLLLELQADGSSSLEFTAQSIITYSSINWRNFDWRGYLKKQFTVEKFVKGKMEEFATKIIGLPIGKGQAVKAVIGASVLLYGHEFTLIAEPYTIWRRWPENPGAKPYESEIVYTIIFNFVPYNDWSQIVVEYAIGQPLPNLGPAPDKRVTWSLGGEIVDHGSLHIFDQKTAGDGVALALFTAYDEKVPPILRNDRHNLDNAFGHVAVRVRDLLPFKWRYLELVVRHVKNTHARELLRVWHYNLPDLQVKFEIESNSYFFSCDSKFTASIPLSRRDDAKYEGTGSLNYISLYKTFSEDWMAINKYNSCTSVPIHGQLLIDILFDLENMDLVLWYSSDPESQEFNTCVGDGIIYTWYTRYGWSNFEWGRLLFFIENCLGDETSPGWCYDYVEYENWDDDDDKGRWRPFAPWIAGDGNPIVATSTQYFQGGAFDDQNSSSTIKIELHNR
jgi:hypothetical protein